MKIMSDEEMRAFGADFARGLSAGEVIELVGDVGAGKTTFVKGLARALGVHDEVQSPTFTLSRSYEIADNRTLTHYDFYRLGDPGIMSMELAESLNDPRNITVLEWAETVRDVLPAARTTTIRIDYLAERGREVTVSRPPKSATIDA